MVQFKKNETQDLEQSKIFREIYGQLTALKHILYSSIQLYNPESMAVLFSKQIKENISPNRNAVWLVEDGGKVAEVASDGKLVDAAERNVFEIDDSDILRRAIRNQRVVWPSSMMQSDDIFPGFESPYLFPIKKHPKAFGFLVADQVCSNEREIYQFFAHFAAMILHISYLHHRVDEQRKELADTNEILFTQNTQLTTLYHVGLNMAKVNDPLHLTRIVTETAVKNLGALRAAAFLLDKGSEKLVGASESGGIKGIGNIKLPPNKEKAVKKSMESGRIISHLDYSKKLRLGSNRLENWVIFPLKRKKNVLGILVIEVKYQDINDSVAILVNHAGMVLYNLMELKEKKKIARANEKLQKANEILERLATIDPLTGLYNFRYFQSTFDAEFSRTKRSGRPLAAIIVDVDNFKVINDRHGHLVGDQVLKEISSRIKKSLRISDTVARYGGDEIVILLPKTNLDKAGSLAERLRSQIYDRPVPVEGNSIQISVSLGVTAFTGMQVYAKENLLKLADQALYSAKKAGKNRVALGEPDT
ncbi:MAG: GGDEF domain-containing protein [Deltaproteobacteria bacterium]|nr:GGDEF domain-containing protein [Deltaproteobacteria bacterium]MBW1940656.1 GGDEF domain-containing protein [Deltaproteobacteria bacterium]